MQPGPSSAGMDLTLVGGEIHFDIAETYVGKPGIYFKKKYFQAHNDYA